MKHILLLFLCSAICLSVHGQALQFARYENNGFTGPFTLAAGDVTSDFGMRNAGPGTTLFHRGIDMVPIGAQNLVVLAPFAGTIVRIDRNGIIDLLIEATSGSPRLDLLHIFDNTSLPITKSGFKLLTVSNNFVIVDLVNPARAEAAPLPGLSIWLCQMPVLFER